MKKKLFVIILICSTLILFFLNRGEEEGNVNSGIINTTIYPIQYLTEQLIGEHVEVVSVVPLGSNPHYYIPTQKQLVEIAHSDMYIYFGLGLEGSLENQEEVFKNEKVKVIEIGKKINLETMGIEEEHEEHEEHEHNTNLHIWIDPIKMIEMGEVIKEELEEQYPKLKKEIENNFIELSEKLKELDEKYMEKLKDRKRDYFIVSHDAFGHLEKYGIKSIPVKDESDSKDPTIKEMEEILKKGRSEKIDYVVYENNIPCLPLEVIKKELEAEKVVMSNVSVLSADEYGQQLDYVDVMEKNLEILKSILN